MSTTIDERVVEMRFDNKQFEQNVSTSMSTLDKLKQKLNLTGASKGLENVDAAARKVNVSGIGTAVESVNAKFSALEVMGVTALANLTNSAVNAGKRIVSALTIDPVKTGFQEYETQINAVQTIYSNTQNKGTTIDDINKALDELNTYADKTIYNFTEMTKNIGTFTAAGVDLDTSVSAIQGIANLAAVSGSTSQQASTAMYQLSQALASGTVKLMDWNSVVNAGMGGEVFQNALKRTAKIMGTDVDALIEKYGSFRETLSSGWLTTDILTETLNQFTMAAKEGTDQWEEYKKSLMDKGYTEAQAEEILKMANNADEAATKVKTFTQLWDVMKESAQSGWTQTWEILIGDYEQAKNLLTPISDFMNGMINSMSEWRNNILSGAMSSPFASIIEKLNSVAQVTETVTEATKNYGEVVDSVINGEWGNGQERWDKLTEAGYDWAHVQNLVNEKLGNSVRHATDYKETQEEVVETQAKTIEQLLKMSDAQLKEIGLTEEEIKAFRELDEVCQKTGISLEDALANPDLLSGRNLLINSFKDLGKVIGDSFKTIKDAWQDIFPPKSTEERAAQLYNLIAAFRKFAIGIKDLIIKDGELTETGENLLKTFKGLFAVIDIISTVLGGAFKIGLKVASEILSYFHLDILDVTAAIGDALVGFRDWVDSILDVGKVLGVVIPLLQSGVKAVKDWINAFLELPAVQKFINGIKSVFNEISNIIKSIDFTSLDSIKQGFDSIVEIIRGKLSKIDFASIGKNILDGLVKGLKTGTEKVWNAVIEIGKCILESIKDFLGIHSPSTKFAEIGKNCILGLVEGLQNGVTILWETLKTIGSKIVEILGNIDWGAVFAAGVVVGFMSIGFKLANAIENLTSPLEGLDDVFKGTSKVMNAFALDLKAKALKNIAIALAILVGSIALLTFLDVGKLWGAIGAIAALAVILGVLTAAIGKFGPEEALELGAYSLALLGISGSLLIIAIALKQVADIDRGNLIKAGIAIAGLGVLIVGLIAATKLFNSDATKVGTTLLLISASMLLLVQVIKQVSKLETSELIRGGAAIIAFGGIIVGLIATTKLFGGSEANKVGGSLIKMVAAILLMLFVAKIAASMDSATLIKGGAAIIAFGAIVAGLIATTRLVGGKDLTKVGTTILAMSASILILSIVAERLSKLDTASLIKGGVAVTTLGGIMVGLVAATNLAGGKKKLEGVAGTLLAMSLSIGIMAGVAALLSLIDIAHLAKGIVAVGLLSGMVALLASSTRNAKNVKGNLIVMTVAIGLLAGILVALTFMDSTKLATAAASISAVIGMFALLMAVTKFTKNTKHVYKTLLVLSGVTAILAGIIAALSFIPNPDAAIKVAGALSILLTAFSTSLMILGAAGRISTTVSKQLAPMLAVTLGLAAIVAALSFIPNPEGTIPTAIALGILLNSLAASMLVLSMAKGVTAGAAGVAAIMALVIGEIAVILGLMQYFNIQPSIETALALSTLLLALSAACIILIPVGAAAEFAVAGAAALAGVVLVLGGLIAALGGLTKIDGFNEVIRDGGETLALIGQAIGRFVGSIAGGLLGGIAEGIMSVLPGIGTSLSEFMENASGFIEGAKTVDGSVLLGVGILATALIALTAVDLVTGLISLIPVCSGFAQLGTDLSDFMNNASGFIEGVKGLDPSVAESVKAIAEMILILTAANVLEGLTSWITGGTSFATFGAQLPELGSSLASFVTNLGSFDESKVATVTCAVNAIKALASAADSLPAEGGWIQKLLGEQSLATFGSQLPMLATNMNGFITNLGTFDDSKVEIVTCAAEAIKSLAESANEIPAEGGWVQKLLGEKSLAAFGGQLPGLGTNLASFVTNLGTFTDAQVDTVTCAGNAVKALAQAASNIDGQAEWAKKIFGDNGLASFGDEMASLGTSLKDFVGNLGTFTEAQVTTVRSAVNAIKALTGLAEADLKGAQKNLPEFSEALPGLATGIVSFTTDMPSSEIVSSAVSSIRKIITVIGEIGEANSGVLSTFADNLKKVGDKAVDKFVSAFTSDTAKTDLKEAAKKLGDKVVDGIEAKESAVKKAAENLADKAADGLDGLEDDGKSAGKDLGSGLVKGIQAKEDAAYNAGYALGQAAVQGEKDGQASNSPSKLTMLAGKWLGEGLVIGIEKMGTTVYNAGSDLGKNATKSISSAISRITDAVDSDMDLQPTITPVLDLSDVQSGANSISSMFNMTPSMGVLANVGAISSAMNRIQNGASNDDVVSAINRLRKDLGNVGGTSYNINGITYDDGSNIADAVKTLTGAIKRGRRV